MLRERLRLLQSLAERKTQAFPPHTVPSKVVPDDGLLSFAAVAEVYSACWEFLRRLSVSLLHLEVLDCWREGCSPAVGRAPWYVTGVSGGCLWYCRRWTMW